MLEPVTGAGGWEGGRKETVPPIELMNLAAAANTVVETDMAFLCLIFIFLQLYQELGWAGGV